ncbi:MAG TPA: class I SAM-dependent methyltransferase [Gemmatimonas sp.]|nr:class I SAM-dependent methyltransferase [Gemmatimonas sp.]
MPKDERERAAVKLGALDLEAYLRDPSRKQQFVTPMFDTIAPRYDAFTRLFSFGMDRRWKRAAIARIVALAQGSGGGRREASARGEVGPRTPARMHAVDLASGTGDFAVAIARGLPDTTVTAIDASPRMIEEAHARLADPSRDRDVAERVRATTGDMCAIDLPTGSADVVTAGYGVRNVPEPAVAVREMARVLRPGGTLVTLDFYRPAFAPWRRLLLWYLGAAGNAVGWWWHRDPVVYGYIARSIDHFMSWQQFSALLEQEGFTVTRVTRYLGGGIALHEATR